METLILLSEQSGNKLKWKQHFHVIVYRCEATFTIDYVAALLCEFTLTFPLNCLQSKSNKTQADNVKDWLHVLSSDSGF